MVDLSHLTSLPVASNVAWVFPGQGAQAVGMGQDLATEHPAAREVFEAADAALGIPISRICFEGPADELTRTVNTQPAIVAHSLAALAPPVASGPRPHRPSFVPGPTLGESAPPLPPRAPGVHARVRPSHA